MAVGLLIFGTAAESYKQRVHADNCCIGKEPGACCGNSQLMQVGLAHAEYGDANRAAQKRRDYASVNNTVMRRSRGVNSSPILEANRRSSGHWVITSGISNG